jgi:hypothetical protein
MDVAHVESLAGRELPVRQCLNAHSDVLHGSSS